MLCTYPVIHTISLSGLPSSALRVVTLVEIRTKCRELSDLVLRALPDMDAAIRIVHRCTALILGLSNSTFRDTVITIVTAMFDVLHGAPP